MQVVHSSLPMPKACVIGGVLTKFTSAQAHMCDHTAYRKLSFGYLVCYCSAMSTSSPDCYDTRQSSALIMRCVRTQEMADLCVFILPRLLLNTALEHLDEAITFPVWGWLVSIPHPNIFRLDHLSDHFHSGRGVPSATRLARVSQKSVVVYDAPALTSHVSVTIRGSSMYFLIKGSVMSHS